MMSPFVFGVTMTSGSLLFGISEGQAFALSLAMTFLCVGAAAVFALRPETRSLEVGFLLLAGILGGTTAYAGWMWRRLSRGT